MPPNEGFESRAKRVGSMDGEALRPLLIQVGDQSFVDEFCAHFTRSGFTIERAGGSMVQVYRLDAPTRDQERLEVTLHVRVWHVVSCPGQSEACTQPVQ